MSDPVMQEFIQLIEPLNKKGITVTPSTYFVKDLEFDSLTVMDLIAETEDHFDITIPINNLPDMETVADVHQTIVEAIKQRNSGSAD